MPLGKAKVGIMTNALHYGTGVFEGIRGNWNAAHKNVYLFRLKEHYERMLKGCKILKIELPYTVDDLNKITTEMAHKCGFKEDIYVRSLAYKSEETIGIQLHNIGADFFVYAIPWKNAKQKKMSKEEVRKVADKCMVSSWRFPKEIARAKFSGLYITNALAKTDAMENGFDEAIMLNAEGYVAEGSGANLFLVMDGKLVTPASYDGCLIGITRATVIQLAKEELGIETIERHVDRVELYKADECFQTGTAANIAPISEIDRRKVGDGEVGKITKQLQELYYDVIKCNVPKYSTWCTPVY